MKRIKSVILALFAIILLGGFVKEDNTITINSDKSMSLEIQTLVKESIVSNGLNSMIEEANDLEQKGFTITQKREDEYNGYIVSKKFNNIDELSNNKGEEINIDTFTEDNFDTTKLFTLKKGFIKDTYTASFKFKNNIDLSRYSANNYETQELDETTEEANELDDESNYIDVTSMGEVVIKYIVKLPYKVADNNASNVSEDEKTLTWSLDPQNINDIKFTFSIYNMKNIYIAALGCALLLIIIIVVLVIIKKKKASRETLIHADYDESIVGKISETQTPLENIPNSSENLEYTMPGSISTEENVIKEDSSPLASEHDDVVIDSVAMPNPAPIPAGPLPGVVSDNTELINNNIE